MEEERLWRLLDTLGPNDFDPDLADRISRTILRSGSSDDSETLRRLMDRTNMRMVLAIYGPVWAKEIGDRLALHGARFIGHLEVTRTEENCVHIADEWEEWIVFPDPSLVRDYVVPRIIDMLRSEWGDDIPPQYIEIDETEAIFDTDEWAGQAVAELTDEHVMNLFIYTAGMDVVEARDVLREQEGDRMMGEVRDNPIEFVRERGYTDCLPLWIRVDYDQAADNWIEQNGLGMEATYYLPSGAVAIRME